MKRNSRFDRAVNLVMAGVLLALAILSASAPQPALAAAACKTYYTVKANDTTSKIAQRYGLKFGEIAKANSMKPPYELEEGQELCIPYSGDEDEVESKVDSKVKLSVVATGDKIFITITNTEDKSAYYAKVREASVGAGGWHKLGEIKVSKKNESVKATFSVPKTLQSSVYLSVCVKNATSDKLNCNTVVNL
jgi:LysM repeat protein